MTRNWPGSTISIRLLPISFHTTRFFKKIKETEILQSKLDETYEQSNSIIEKQNNIIEKQKKELLALKKKLASSK